MKWNEYLTQSEKTLSHEFHCGDHQTELMLHATMGILTEFEELLDNHQGQEDKVNIMEEVADIFWYLAIFARQYDIEMPHQDMMNHMGKDELVIASIKQTLKVLDVLKKKLFYNKPIDHEMVKFTTNYVIVNMRSYLWQHNIDMKDALERNIEKLKARYGDKFTSEKAINRDIDRERKILESEADAETFFNAIDNPPEPNETLLKAKKDYETRKHN